MTINKALQTIIECADYDDDVAREWDAAISYIINQLGVVFDAETEQWVTSDTGDVI